MNKVTFAELMKTYNTFKVYPPGPNVKANIYIGNEDGSQQQGTPGEAQFWARDRKGTTWHLVIWQARP